MIRGAGYFVVGDLVLDLLHGALSFIWGGVGGCGVVWFDGKHMMRARQYSFCIMTMIELIDVVGVIVEVVDDRSARGLVVVVSCLAWFGLFLFGVCLLMVWEVVKCFGVSLTMVSEVW